jgi:hypothetical protein
LSLLIVKPYELISRKRQNDIDKNDNLTPTEKTKNTREHRKVEIEKTANKVEDSSMSSPQERPSNNTYASASSVVYLPRRRPR